MDAGTQSNLEDRLRRVEFLITGQDGPESPELSTTTQPTIHTRLARIEEKLQTVSSRSKAVRDLLQLHSNHPTLFTPNPNDLSTFTTPEKLAIVSSSASLFSTTVFRLTSIQDNPIPAPNLSAALIALQPRIRAVEEMQQEHSQQVAELTFQTASLLQRWYELWVIGGGECWAEWEERLMGVERAVRREEGRRAKEKIVI